MVFAWKWEGRQKLPGKASKGLWGVIFLRPSGVKWTQSRFRVCGISAGGSGGGGGKGPGMRGNACRGEKGSIKGGRVMRWCTIAKVARKRIAAGLNPELLKGEEFVDDEGVEGEKG